jgi:hypothetical protein
MDGDGAHGAILSGTIDGMYSIGRGDPDEKDGVCWWWGEFSNPVSVQFYDTVEDEPCGEEISVETILRVEAYAIISGGFAVVAYIGYRTNPLASYTYVLVFSGELSGLEAPVFCDSTRVMPNDNAANCVYAGTGVGGNYGGGGSATAVPA